MKELSDEHKQINLAYCYSRHITLPLITTWQENGLSFSRIYFTHVNFKVWISTWDQQLYDWRISNLVTTYSLQYKCLKI